MWTLSRVRIRTTLDLHPPRSPLSRHAALVLAGARRCLGCARSFLDLPRLAQHIADKHGGVNAVPSLHSTGPTPGAMRFGDVAALRPPPAAPAAPAPAPRQLLRHQPPATKPAPLHLSGQAAQAKRPGDAERAPRGAAAAAALAAPEGTHAKVRKRPSALKRGFRRARALQAVEHWQGVLAAIEEAVQAAGEALGAAENERSLLLALAAAAEGPSGAGVVRLQVVDVQLALGRDRQEQLLR